MMERARCGYYHIADTNTNISDARGDLTKSSGMEGMVGLELGQQKKNPCALRNPYQLLNSAFMSISTISQPYAFLDVCHRQTLHETWC